MATEESKSAKRSTMEMKRSVVGLLAPADRVMYLPQGMGDKDENYIQALIMGYLLIGANKDTLAAEVVYYDSGGQKRQNLVLSEAEKNAKTLDGQNPRFLIKFKNDSVAGGIEENWVFVKQFRDSNGVWMVKVEKTFENNDSDPEIIERDIPVTEVVL